MKQNAFNAINIVNTEKLDFSMWGLIDGENDIVETSSFFGTKENDKYSGKLLYIYQNFYESTIFEKLANCNPNGMYEVDDKECVMIWKLQ